MSSLNFVALIVAKALRRMRLRADSLVVFSGAAGSALLGCNELFDIEKPTLRATEPPGVGGMTGNDGETVPLAPPDLPPPGFSANSGGGGAAGSLPVTGGAAGDAGPDVLVPPGACEGEGLRGAELAEIPPGSLSIGAIDLDNAQPLTLVSFATFCVDRTEVTQGEYAACVADGGCDAPNTELDPDCNWQAPERNDHPVNCIDFSRADAYCRWAGKRLPTEKEWEFAARGPQGRLCPWGNEAPSGGLLNWGNEVNATTPVGSYPAGATPGTGLLDLAGNVWEWTASPWCDSYAADAVCGEGDNVTRGGGWASTQDIHVRASWRDGDAEGDNRFGFRCALGDGERAP